MLDRRVSACRPLLHSRGERLGCHAITGTPVGGYSCPSEQLMGQLRAELDFASVASVIQRGLHEYLDGLQLTMNQIDLSLRSDFAVSGVETDGTSRGGWPESG